MIRTFPTGLGTSLWIGLDCKCIISNLGECCRFVYLFTSINRAIYHRGAAWPWVNNTVPNATYIADAIKGQNIASLSNFYEQYTVHRRKPMMIAETGAVHHLKSDWTDAPLADAITIKQAWWRQYLNSTFITTFPNLRM